MRTPNLGSVIYSPSSPPSNPALLAAWWEAESIKIQAAFQALAAGHIDRAYKEPAKPRDGNKRYADGAPWNPGSGKGEYRFDGDTQTWVILG
jgi:hypothetical protein